MIRNLIVKFWIYLLSMYLDRVENCEVTNRGNETYASKPKQTHDLVKLSLSTITHDDGTIECIKPQ